MNFLNRNVSSLTEAHLTKRMLMNVPIADACPGSAVSFPGGIATGEVFVLALRQLLVFLAVV